MKTLIGFDIGGTKTAIVEGTYKAEVLQRREVETEANKSFSHTFPQLTTIADELIENATLAGRKVTAVSVSVGGPLEIAAGVLHDPPHLPGWHGVQLKRELESRFPGYPVRIEHDGNAGALAEFSFGIGSELLGLQHLVFLTLGTGLGAGIILNGRIHRGANDTAGELGHIRLSSDGPFLHGKAGSWEGLCSGVGMLELARQMFPSEWRKESSIKELVEAMLAGKEDALAVAQEAGIWLGRGLAILIDLLNPEVIVLGSLAVVLGDLLLVPARQILRVEALPTALRACRIMPARLGKSIGDVAALMAVLNDPELRYRFHQNL